MERRVVWGCREEQGGEGSERKQMFLAHSLSLCVTSQRRWRPCLGGSHHSWQEEVALVAPLTPSFPSASLGSNQETRFAP